MRPPVSERTTTVTGLLTRHFLRRLMDNDLVSPHADRHASLVVLSALILSLAVFVTFLLSTGYLASFIQLPGPTALSALSDRFLFIGAAAAISALAALMVWDALSLEARDTAILGPLPIPPRAIAHAKLAAALIFGAASALALNVLPSVLYPAFLTLNLHGIGAGGVLELIAVQGIAMFLAGLFGFFAVLALRGVLCLVLGRRGFHGVSNASQSALVIGVLTALLLTPIVGAATVRNWVAGDVPPRWPALPALWYLGVNETLAGHIVADTPLVLPSHLPPTRRLRERNTQAKAAYRALAPSFEALANAGLLALPLVAFVAIGGFLWNNRRLPEPSDGAPATSRARLAVGAIAERLTRGNAEAQAGFFFTLQSLSRSGAHRLILAASVAAAAALPLVVLVGGGAHPSPTISSTPLGLFGIQVMVVSALVGGFRHAVAVPAELASNWAIRMAWRGDERAYLAGVKRAALLLFVAAPVVLLLPLHIAFFGPGPALVHSLYGVLFGAALLDGLFLGYRKLPFVCSHVPIQNLTLVGSGVVTGVLLATYGMAWIERAALPSPAGAAALAVTLAGLVVTLTVVDRAQRRERWPLDFDEGPAPPTQRLGLSTSTGLFD